MTIRISRSPDSSHPRRRGEAGYTLVAVLLAVAVMAGLVATYGRHVVVAGRGGMASPQLLGSRDDCQSGLVYARQALVSGSGDIASSIPIGDGLASVSVTHTADGHDVLFVESVGGDGLGSRRKAELAMQPVPSTDPAGPAALPTLSPATVAALLADTSLPKLSITSSTRISNAELDGLVVIYPGVELQLDDVVVHGAVISANVLSLATLGSYNAQAAPQLLVDGNVRIDPPQALAGLAILMPDGKVSSGMIDARIQIHGDVVAHDISLLHKGALFGNVAGVNVTLAAPSLLDRAGSERKPPAWSAALQLGGGNEPVFFAPVPVSASLGSLSAIMGFWNS